MATGSKGTSACSVCGSRAPHMPNGPDSCEWDTRSKAPPAAQEQKPVALGIDVDPAAIDALKNYQRQLDPDGDEVGVSRQALDEVLTAIERVGLSASHIPALGWVMVPRKGTKEMWAAYARQVGYSTMPGDVWDAMLAAAPVAPKGET